MSSTKKVLEETLRIIESPERWTQGVAARDKHGNPCMATDDAARCWCVLGALSRAAENIPKGWDARGEAYDILASCLPGGMSIGLYNDRGKHEDAVRLLKNALLKIG